MRKKGWKSVKCFFLQKTPFGVERPGDKDDGYMLLRDSSESDRWPGRYSYCEHGVRRVS